MLRVVALLAVCMLTGCSRAQLQHQSDALNRASAVTMNEQVLLNAVRSSLDLPMSFTKLQRYVAGPMGSAGLAPKIPFGADAVLTNDLGVTLTVNPGVNQIEYADVNTAGGLSKLNENLQYDAIDRYIRDGVPLPVLFSLFTSYIEVHESLMLEMRRQFERKCLSRPVYAKLSSPEKSACDELAAIKHVERCNLWTSGRIFRLERNEKFLLISNHAHTKCSHLAFRSLGLMMRLSGFVSDLVPGESRKETAMTPELRRVTVQREGKPTQWAKFQEDSVQNVYDRLKYRLKAHTDTKHRTPIRFALRSPRQLLSYLGELIAIQNYGEERYMPQVSLAPGTDVPLFRVLRGPEGLGSAALAVTGPYGEVYYVPHPAYGTASRDPTLRVLTIVTELVNGAISEKDFPVPTTVVVR